MYLNTHWRFCYANKNKKFGHLQKKINAMGPLSQCWVPCWLLVLSQEPRHVVEDLALPT